MGHDIHLTRRVDRWDEDGPEITADEWEAVVASGAEPSMIPAPLGWTGPVRRSALLNTRPDETRFGTALYWDGGRDQGEESERSADRQDAADRTGARARARARGEGPGGRRRMLRARRETDSLRPPTTVTAVVAGDALRPRQMPHGQGQLEP